MENPKALRILGIETSCDETAISLIEVDGATRKVRVLGNTVHSQIDMHSPHGGVFPMLAKREHQANLVPVLQRTLEEAGGWKIKSKDQDNKVQDKEKKALLDEIFAREPELRVAFEKVVPALARPDIDYIAVTYGPGLEPALWVGIAFARALGALWDIPVIPCNHMEGHVLTGIIKKDPSTPNSYDGARAKFPALSLLISGGHTQIVLAEKIGSYKIVGETLDDAIGECFDKVARMLDLAYPGGPKISKLAAEARREGIQSPEPLPRPMMHSKDLNFSFSGLKTAVLYLVKKLKDTNVEMTDAIRKGISREVEDAITDVVIEKMRKAIEIYAVQSIIVGGGVIANTHIREALEKLATDCSIGIFLPQTDHATDNGLMIALAGYFNREKAQSAATFIKANGTLPIGPKASTGTQDLA